LAFNNPRKFGRVWLLDDPGKVLGDLGPEPLDENFTAECFYQHLSRYKRQIKPLLIDQKFIAGLGNIYTDEALNLAKIHPLMLSNQLSFKQAELLLNSIRGVLKEGIRQNGASIDWVYQGGEFQNHFRVYQREGEPCPECKTPITRIVVGQRGTHLCTNCQVTPGWE
jgi:formamidopyrimidine-DNA glycosylase